jgi:hypothetical protein
VIPSWASEMRLPVQRCSNCQTELTPGNPCPHCGQSAGVVVTPPPASVHADGFTSIIVAGKDPITGDDLITVDDPGVKSEARLKAHGQVSLSVKGAANIGTRSEPRAIKTLRQKLQANGAVSIEKGKNDRGEDAILSCDGHQYTLQLVTAPGANEFWRNASVGRALTEMQTHQAADLLREAIRAKAAKTSKAERAPLLVLTRGTLVCCLAPAY